jgi:hypothetical protein
MQLRTSLPSRESWRSLRQYLPLALVFAAGVSGIICASCEDDLTGLRPSDVVFPDSGISYSQHVDALFQQSCASTQCHGGSTPAGELNLEYPSYRSLLDHRPHLVLSGDGANSLLVLRLTGAVGERMPLRMPALNENQIRGIRRWIDEGAINN